MTLFGIYNKPTKNYVNKKQNKISCSTEKVAGKIWNTKMYTV